jgi:hypothetical protein
LGACVLAFVLAACVPHPVGPARTFAKYEGKAVTTAESALSAVETARLTAEAASKGNSFGPYTASVIADSEAAATGVQGTFGSIQPPGPEADKLRSELDQLLSDAASHLTDLRVAARRGRLAELSAVAAPLAEDADRLRAFAEEHG